MKLSTLLLPNRAFTGRMRSVDPRTRLLYWTLRIGLTLLLLLLAGWFLATTQQHRQLN